MADISANEMAVLEVGHSLLDIHMTETQNMFESAIGSRDEEITRLKKDHLLLSAYTQYSTEVILSGLTPVTYQQFVDNIWNEFPLH